MCLSVSSRGVMRHALSLSCNEPLELWGLMACETWCSKQLYACQLIDCTRRCNGDRSAAVPSGKLCTSQQAWCSVCMTAQTLLQQYCISSGGPELPACLQVVRWIEHTKPPFLTFEEVPTILMCRYNKDGVKHEARMVHNLLAPIVGRLGYQARSRCSGLLTAALITAKPVLLGLSGSPQSCLQASIVPRSVSLTVALA